jgi:hypothetical protein
MKLRTIDELHDSEIGHKRFAKVCDILIARGYDVTCIREYNEHFKFFVGDKEYQYRKDWKASAKRFVEYLENLIAMEKELTKLKG